MINSSKRADLIIDLQNRGYDRDFIIKNEGILCIQENDFIHPDGFEIVETHHFENRSGSGDHFVIYAISLLNSGAKGILMTTSGTYNRGLSIHLWFKLSDGLKKALADAKSDFWLNRLSIE